MVWRCHGILCFHRYFVLLHFILFFFVCLEVTLLGKDSWKRATSATAMVIFSKVLFQKLIDHSYVKVSSQKLGGTSTTEFWRTPYGWRFTDMDTCYFFHQNWQISWNENQRSCYENYHFFFSKKLVFKSDPIFIDILDSF